MSSEVCHFESIEKTLVICDSLLIYQYTEIFYHKNRIMLKHHYINTNGLKDIKMEIFNKIE